MPIRPSEKTRYPKNWKAISLEIRNRALWRCECMGECRLHRSKGPLRCREHHGEKARWAKGKVILTVAHLDHKPENVRRKNLKAMCQRCHLRYDRFQHAANARKTREAKSPQLRLGPGRRAGGGPMPTDKQRLDFIGKPNFISRYCSLISWHIYGKEDQDVRQAIDAKMKAKGRE